MIAVIMLFVFFSVGLVTYAVVPIFAQKTAILNEQRTKKFASKMERILMKSDVKRLSTFHMLAPVAGAAGGLILFPAELKFFGFLVGLIIGLIFPGMFVKQLISKRKQKFDDQMVDALMIMSSSFRGGLSLVQAMEAVVEEMPDPIDQEFGTVLSENKMGVSLEEALKHLYERMPSSALQQTITAILLARETGGNLPMIFTRIVNTIREHKKIQQSIDTLTLQGKIQGVVMSLLPIGFAFVVNTTNPKFFQHMFHSEVGKLLLMLAFILEILGIFFIWRISTFKDF